MNKRLIITLAFCGLWLSLYAELVYYSHPELHLNFALDTVTKEASIGTGLDEDENAIALPPFSDPWWNESPLTNYWQNLDIPSTITCDGVEYTVTAVSSRAFYKCLRIQTVKLPETVQVIGNEAFYWCTGLRTINIPSQVTDIFPNAFQYCRNLESMHLPNGLLTIRDGAFSDCKNLKEVIIPGSCTSIGDDAFMGCSALHKIIIEDGTEALNVGSSFRVSLLYESIDENKLDLREHQRGLFGDCAIDTLYLGRNIIYPYGYDWKSTTSSQWTNRMRPFPPFEKCSKYDVRTKNYYYSGYTLSSLQFGETLTDIPDSLFAVTTITCDISLPSNLQRIGKMAFYNSKNNYIPRKLEIPQRVEYIGEEAFCQNQITELTLHEGLKTIEKRAFYDNVISSLTIPSTLTYFGPDAFSNNNIIFVYSNPITPPEGSFSGSPIVYVPAGTGKTYREKGWRNIIDFSEEQLTINVRTAGTLYSRILAQDFQLSDVFRLKLKGTLNEDDWATIANMDYLYDLDLSELNLEELPNGYFQNKTKLYRITFPNVLQSIEDNAFVGCSHLGGQITIPSTCTSVGNRAFYGLNIGGIQCNGSTHIQEEAFMNCTFLKDVTLTEGTEIGTGAFLSTSIEELVVPANVKLGNKAFKTETLKRVTFNGGDQEIGEDVFPSTVKLFAFNDSPKTIKTFASHVNRIDVNDIYTWCELPFPNPVSCDTLYINGEEAQNIVIPNDITKLRSHLFYECPSIVTAQLPNRVTEIPMGAFKGCANLTSVSMPSKLLSIGDSAFAKCSSLSDISLPKSTSTIGSYAFAMCYGLRTVQLSSQLMSIGERAFSECSSLEKIQLPSQLASIGNSAFYHCISLETLDLPLSITSVGETAFAECKGLNYIVAHWREPIKVLNVSGNCLYVPIGTAQKYVNAGWDFQNMKEKGILRVKVNKGGEVKLNSESAKDETKQFYFTPYSSFEITFTPDEGYSLKRIRLNGENLTEQIEDGKIYVEDAEEDISLSVIFADNSIVDGDVNGDGLINGSDAISTANYILKYMPGVFYDFASDVNGDDCINITDIILITKKVSQ